MEPTAVDVEELIGLWTLLDEVRELVVGERTANALEFALLMKYYSRHGRFSRGRSDLSDPVIGFVAEWALLFSHQEGGTPRDMLLHATRRP